MQEEAKDANTAFHPPPAPHVTLPEAGGGSREVTSWETLGASHLRPLLPTLVLCLVPFLLQMGKAPTWKANFLQLG